MDDYKKVDVSSLYYRLIKSLIIALIFAVIISFLPTVGMIGANAWSWLGFFLMIGIIATPVFLIGLIASLLEYAHLKYKIAEQSVNFRDGALSVHTTSIPFSKITTASYDQGLLARLFSVGDINIDQEDSEFSFKGVGSKIANEVLDIVAKKSNILPVSAKKA